jgi:hypothetical protein
MSLMFGSRLKALILPLGSDRVSLPDISTTQVDRSVATNVYSIAAKLEDGSGSNNLIIWESKTGAQLAAFSQKAYSNS